MKTHYRTFRQPDLIGKSFGRLTVISFSHTIRNKNDNPIHFWRLQCICGKIVIRKKITLGQFSSCGCYRIEERSMPRKPREIVFINKIICQYKGAARKRSLCWKLSFSEVQNIVTANCFYCDASPSNNIRKSFLYSGIDRYDNKIGYIKTNVVPCCARCNHAKNSSTPQEFFSWIKRIVMKYEKIKV